jgi:GLPGLI family protein
MKMKYNWFFNVFLFCTISIFAQSKNMIVTYKVTYLDDELLSEGMKDIPKSLRHIKDVYEYALSEYERYFFSLHIADKKSIFMFDKEKSNLDALKDNSFVLSLYNYFGNIYNVNDSIYPNIKLLGKNIYKKSPKISHWVLHQESKLIGSYLCYKATNTKVVDGQNGKIFNHPVIAWFCPEIPLQFGPIGYGNLPGLIIELQVRNVVYGVSHIDYNPINFFDFSEFNKIKIYNETQINEMFENGLD